MTKLILTPSQIINHSNKSNVQCMIAAKQTSYPYHGTSKPLVITDHDHFPYYRWYRGRYDSTEPIVAEREAGFRPHNDKLYNPPLIGPDPPGPNLCFSIPCNTILPCIPPRR